MKAGLYVLQTFLAPHWTLVQCGILFRLVLAFFRDTVSICKFKCAMTTQHPSLVLKELVFLSCQKLR